MREKDGHALQYKATEDYFVIHLESVPGCL